MKKYPQQKKTTKAPKKITERYLRNVAKYYLERHIASSDQFRKVLQKRVYKSVRYHHSNTSQKPDNTDVKPSNVKSSNVKPSKKKIETVDYHTALEQALALVEKEVQHRIEKGELNDLEFSRNKVRMLHKQGNSKMQIKTKLYQKESPLILSIQLFLNSIHLRGFRFSIGVTFHIKSSNTRKSCF